MKKILTLIFICFLVINAKSQIIINQYVVEEPPYAVGDEITINYEVINNNGSLQYLWFRFHYSNKHIELVPGSTIFHQGTQTQNFFHQWIGYNFTPNPNIGVGDLYGQYNSSGWGYTLNSDWNVVQLALQNSNNNIDGLFASQKFKVKDNTDYNSIHRLHMAYAVDNNGIIVNDIGSKVLWLSLNDVKTIANFKIHLHHPQGYGIQSHKVNLLDKDNNIIESKFFDSSGEALFTGILNDTEYIVNIEYPKNESFMDEIVSVSDAYKGFLQITDKGLFNDNNVFNHPIEYIVGNVKKEGEGFTNIDSYYLFAHVMGIDVSDKARIPSSNANSLPKFYWGDLFTYKTGGFNKIIYPTENNNVFDFAFAWGGDIDFSHSTPINTNNESNRVNKIIYKEEYIEIVTRIENNKLVLDSKLSSDKLTGVQIVLYYDNKLLDLENIVFNTGNNITNFKNINNGKISFGSIDQIGTETIKNNQPYRLIFNSKIPINNTSGLIYIKLTDAVDITGNKIKLIVK